MSLNYQVPFDGLPVEIIAKILGYVGLENVIQFTSHDDFLALNPNIRTALNGLIATSNISYNNRFMQYSFVHMYQRTKTYVDKYDLVFIDEDLVVPLVQHCVRENLEMVLTLSYYVWSLSDIVEMVALIDKLPNSVVRYNLEMEVVPGFLYIFNLNYLFDAIGARIGDSIDTVMVYNYSGSFRFNNNNFPNLKTLWFEDSNIKFGGSLPTTLKRLFLHPNKFGWNNNHQVKVNQNLPANLDHLHLGDCSVGAIHSGGNISSIELRKIRAKDSNSGYDFAKEVILKNFLRGSLKELSIDMIWNSRNSLLDVNQEILRSPEAQAHIHDLSKVAFTGFCPLLDHCANLRNLRILQLTDPAMLDDYKFPPNLVELSLDFNGIKNLLPIDKNIVHTTRLKVLNLADNPIDWSLYVPNFKRFKNLRFLKLSNTLVGEHFPKITYPESLVELSLEVNLIRSFLGVVFPETLKNLGIGSNSIKVVNRPHLPAGIETIHLTDNFIDKVDLSCNSRGEELMIEILYVNYNKLSMFEFIKYPNHLKILNFDNCKISSVSGVEFPATLMELGISGCELEKFENVTWGSSHPQLKYLNLSQNNLKVFDNKLPPSIEMLNLSQNELSSLSPSVLSNLECLKTVYLSSNEFTRFNYQFNIINLQTLDLSFNSIKALNLTFPKNITTKFMVLNLCLNKLTNLTPQMIGHNKNLTMHANMVEIDLTNNKIKSSDITDKLAEFPNSLLCFFIGLTGEQDRFGFDLAKNVVDSGLCRGKRIDIP
ncbi:Protein artichoke [Candida viswanathii]|uniref:Protein artichoke n=1 Tax=Candida viswanathii TaxID=5486 RepID=A0A367Y9E6_9ASCO|nr:Protein artichoke [Candida viswanathii]